MRLHAEVEVVNRLVANHGLKGKGKKAKSHLAIGRKHLADGDNEIFLMVSSNANKQGVKYMIKDNIGNIFTRMINEGRTTIRFNDPPHDLCIKGDDVIQVKSFLMALKKVMEGKGLDKLTLSALQPVSTKQLEGPKKKMSILKRGDYPATTGFPITLQSLIVSGVRLARVDNRMLKLWNLVSLDLSSNEITCLPDGLGQMAKLQELNVSGNQLVTLPRSLCTGPLINSLKLINLTDNKITLLPNYFCNLRQLVNICVGSNQLKLLPPSIGKLTNLKHLQASGNHLKVLPGGFTRLRLDTLELSANDLEEGPSESKVLRNRLETVPSLLEIVAVTLATRGVRPGPEDVTPQLLNYLDSGMKCLCGRPVWNNVVTTLLTMDITRVATEVSAGGITAVNIEASLCSTECLKKFQNNPYAV